MPRSAEEIEWNKKQAAWFRSCSYSHCLWCNCGDWTFHIKKLLWPGDIKGVGFPGGKEGGHFVDGFITGGGGDGFPLKDIEDPPTG